jgi:hypothetical protein
VQANLLVHSLIPPTHAALRPSPPPHTLPPPPQELHAILKHPTTGAHAYAYETDGFGNAMWMDDANVPSLLSLPYLGFLNTSDPTYQATRKLVLSTATNPWFFAGTAVPVCCTLFSVSPSFSACVCYRAAHWSRALLGDMLPCVFVARWKSADVWGPHQLHPARRVRLEDRTWG